MKKIICGGTGTGKTSFLMKEYERLIRDERVPSERILVLLMNRNQSLNWRRENSLGVSGRILRTSFFGFVQEEISKFYPILLKNVPEIKSFSVEPVFLTFESSQFLLSMLIEQRRNGNLAFYDLVMTDSKLAIDISSNFVKAAAAALSYQDIGKRLYSALEVKSEEKRAVFEEADKIIEAYRKRCLECGVMDFAMAVDFYRTVLLQDETYRRSLKKRFDYLLVDNLEEAVPMQVDLIDLLSDVLKGCILSYNPDGGYGGLFGGNKAYAEQVLFPKFVLENAENESFTCEKAMVEFSDMLFDGIQSGKAIGKVSPEVQFIRMPEVTLRSDMLANVAEYIKGLVTSGYREKDISLVSTYADLVTEYVLESHLLKSGIKLNNISRKNRFIDNKFVYALITLGYLCHPQEDLVPTKDDVRAFISMVLDVDPIRSSVLADIVCAQNPFAEFPEVTKWDIVHRIGYKNVKKYNFIRNWINEYRAGVPMEIDLFFQKVFTEILLTYGASEQDIIDIKRLIDSAYNFKKTVSKFHSVDVNRGFLKMIRNNVKSAESIFELEERGEETGIVLATPMSYLSNSLSAKVIILIGFSSDHWLPRCAREISNPFVLTKTWRDGEIYSEEIEEQNQRENMAILMRGLLQRTGEKFVTFESRYSGDGFENDGILPKLFA
ncbi:MAG: hypothetical protein J6M02_04560 [Clostridia bacterium]|nr:hypothetical protein [Clostridia bacterium]